MFGIKSDFDSVLLVTIDSLRRDHLSPYGCNMAQAPTIDMLASNGLLFTNAVSHGGGTPESFPSILCSVPPPRELEDRDVRNKKTMSQYLMEAGFTTAAFHSNPYLTSVFGYHKGFNYFFQGDEKNRNKFFTALDVLRNKAPITNAKRLTAECINWLKKQKKPFFIWIHYMDTHFPYLPPSHISGVTLTLKGRILWPILMYRNIQNKYSRVSEEIRTTLIRLYDKSIEYVDRELAKLLSELYKHSRNPLVVLTSDHGEAFWEHDVFGHSFLYDETIRVPLIICAKGLNGYMEKQVGLSGILPTLLGLLEISYDDKFYGENLIIIQNTVPVVSVSLDIPFNMRVVACRMPTWKYMRKEKFDGQIVSEELYLLDKDPLEKNNQISSRKDLVDKANKIFKKTWIQATKTKETQLTKQEKEAIGRRLRALGYLE